MARLNTTTFSKRNYDFMKSFKHHIKTPPKSILHIGPGGILKSFAPYINHSFKGRMIKIVEQILRRFSFLKIESFEPFEIYEIYGEAMPELTVIDIHDRVLDSINNKNSSKNNIVTKNFDISTGEFPNKKFDLIICIAVINWESQPYKKMIDNTVASTNIGGYIMLSTNFSDYVESLDNLEKIDWALYKRLK